MNFVATFLVSLSLIQSVISTGIFVVHLLTYINYNGYKNNKMCCDDTKDCYMNPCDPRLTVCFSSAMDIKYINQEKCDIGYYVTDQYVDKNEINFGSILGSNLQNPLNNIFVGKWKNLVHILFQIDDIDSDTHELIDVLNTTVSVKATLFEETSLNTFYSIQGDVSAINFTVSAYCSKYYYGSDCLKYCKEIPNQYGCDKSGFKKCHEYWFGYECSVFCKASNSSSDGHFYCTSEGQKVCHPDWYGDKCDTFCGKDSRYTCNVFGKKVCHNNFFGIDCSTYCHKSEGDHFNCSQSGQKICYKNWYGSNCNKSCIETTHFHCNPENGERICSDNYFGLLCDKYCHAKSTDHYKCDKTGNKVCFEHYYGKDCTVYVPSLPKKESVCVASGLSFIKTFDNRYLTFPGVCTYQLAADCIDDTFAIHMRYSLSHDNQWVTLYLGDIDILLTSNEIFVNSQSITLPFTRKSIFIENIAGYVVIDGWNGLGVRWDGKSLYLELHPIYANKTCGLCGNFNGNPVDDIADINGHITESQSTFIKSWKRTKVGEVCVFDKEVMHNLDLLLSDEVKRSSSQCNKLVDALEFKVCNKKVSPDPYLKKCLDCGSTQNCVCNILTEYSRECGRKGIVLNWRQKNFCYINCSNGFEYTECGSLCTKTCKNFHQNLPCEHKCADGCFCPDNLVLHDNKCIEPSQCPCDHNKKIYMSGSKINRECNNCTCTNGQWDCTKHACNGRCSGFGGVHFISFDGKWFDFNGVCEYMMAGDCMNDSFKILLDNTGCSLKDSSACMKAISVHINSSSIVLRHGKMVSVNGVSVKMPYFGSGFKIKQVSSIFVLFTSDIGVEVLFDGEAQFHVTLSAQFKKKTCGLCGTFNDNQMDDFDTIKGIRETNAISFGNTWQYNSNCKIATLQKHPCDIEPQRAHVADKKCNKIRLSPFDSCHHVVDPNSYVATCRYDVCGCYDGVKCLCEAIAAYTKECAERGVVIEWRNKNILPECEVTCLPGLEYQECGNKCLGSCSNIASDCVEGCIAGCNCPNGTLLNDLGTCVPIDECSCFENGISYPSGYLIARGNCEKCKCLKGQFNCTRDEKCSSQQCPHSQIWGKTQGCYKTCETIHLPCLNNVNVAGCHCPNNTVWDSSSSKCVEPEQCPCHHNGRTYQNGASFTWDCNKCFCIEKMWKCTANTCPGTCSVYGESHLTTFDGKMFMFEGKCSYILAEDNCLHNNGSFSLHTQNVACGGSTCTKLITLTVNDTMLYFEKSQKIRVLPSFGHFNATARIKIIETTFFIIVHTEFGITLLWDTGTRLILKLDPKFRGKTCGLCGNFNDNQLDDFTTRQLDVVVSAENFVDSWKVHSACPDSKVPVHPCFIHKSRASWSHKQCNIINREIFQSCHEVVDPQPYFDACFYDACSCDMGGDCECLCTAIAAYAEACNYQGVNIKWRSQDLCPIQCETCQEYKACGSSNPLTCRNICSPKLNLPIDCVEGCFCPNNTVYHNKKCIPQVECPCFVNDIEYAPNTLFINNCQQCQCIDGCFQCTGEICPTYAPSSTETNILLSTSTKSSKSDQTTLTNSQTITSNEIKTTTPVSTLSSVHSTSEVTSVTVSSQATTSLPLTTSSSRSKSTLSRGSEEISSTTTSTSIITDDQKKTSGAPLKSDSSTYSTSTDSSTSQSILQSSNPTVTTTLSSSPTTTGKVNKNTSSATLSSTTTYPITSQSSLISSSTESSAPSTTSSSVPISTSSTSTTKETTEKINEKTSSTTLSSTGIPSTTTSFSSTVSTISDKTTTHPTTSQSSSVSSSTESLTPSTTSSSVPISTSSTSTTKETTEKTNEKTSSTTLSSTGIPSTTTSFSSTVSDKTTTHPTTSQSSSVSSSTESLTPSTTLSSVPISTSSTSTTKETTEKINEKTSSTTLLSTGIPSTTTSFSSTVSTISDKTTTHPTTSQSSSVSSSTESLSASSTTSSSVPISTSSTSATKETTGKINEITSSTTLSSTSIPSPISDKTTTHPTTSQSTSVSSLAESSSTTLLKTTSTTDISSSLTFTKTLSSSHASTLSSTSSTSSHLPCKVSPWKYMCLGDNSCINSTQVCDGKNDCVGGNDEYECPSSCPLCSKENFKCHKTCQCTSIYFVCDGNKECNDGSDELGCPIPTTTVTYTTTNIRISTTIGTIPACPNNKVYQQCSRNCINLCSYLLNNCYEDSRECNPGCGCEDGLLNNGTHCVLPSSCSCYDPVSMVYHKGGDHWERNCHTCSCFNNSINCVLKDCPNLYCPPPHSIVSDGCCPKCILGTSPPTTIVTSTVRNCLNDEFMCSDHKCIPNDWLCDGERDCYDAGDERTCEAKKPSCFQPVGVSLSSVIPESHFSASSSRGSPYRPSNGRFNLASHFTVSAGAWCAEEHKPPHWLQIDLGKDFYISHIGIQGRHLVLQFVQSFLLKYSMNGYTWDTYSYHGQVRVFQGNRDPIYAQTVKLEHKVLARFTRIVIEKYMQQPCMRIELYGCSFSQATTPVTTTEINTKAPTCREFKCSNGNCIVNRWVCDGKKDCLDGLDESQATCNQVCSNDEFQCQSGYCLSTEHVCDGDTDCFDESDEKNCTEKVCDQFKCPNGKCILSRYVCDGEKDCPTGDDEFNCTKTTPQFTTISTQTMPWCNGFRCFKTNLCIPFEYKCDGYKDCRFGEDETCCTSDKFLCPSNSDGYFGNCIPKRTLCDGYQDCADGFDEVNCTYTTTSAIVTTPRGSTQKLATTSFSTISQGSTFSTTHACLNNSVCLCENTCDSLSSNPQGCAQLNCFKDCTCPHNYVRNNETGYCHQNINCPCVHLGKIYGIGTTVMLRNCTVCQCMLHGFQCVSMCEKQSCPDGFEMYYPLDECCSCRKKTVCRSDQVVSGCACPTTCEQQVNKTCDVSNCQKGCVCPMGQHDNGTHCIPAEKCYCLDNQNKVYKANMSWEHGECDICKCANGKISCGKLCKFTACPIGFELLTIPNSCCECVAKSSKSPTTSLSPTVSNTFTTVSSSFSSTSTTKHPTNVCNMIDFKELYTDAEKCSSEITRSTCHGACEVSVISDFINGPIMKDCSCCKPTALYNTTVTLNCLDGRKKSFMYIMFKDCSCLPCDSSPFRDVPLSN
nr:SCO-spondin isoform X2 [Hydra vulgaris]